MNRRWPLVGMLVLALCPLARAADHTILGTSFVVKDPGPETRRKVIVKAREAGSDAALVGDPVTDGAVVTITAGGATPSAETFLLPAGTSPLKQKPFWTGDAVRGFKYADSKGENGPVKRAQVQLKGGVFQLKVTVDGRLGPVGVLPPNPGFEACVLLAIGGGDSYSVRFADGWLTNEGAVLFKITKPTLEGSCVPSTTTSTTTTSTTSSSTTTLATPYTPPPGAAPLRYRDLVFASASVTSNIVYGSAVNYSGQTVTLFLDLYRPVGDVETARPAIVWVHGGGFATGSKTSPELVDQATVFARKGYVNASISYRLESPGCSAGAPTVQCIVAIQEAMQDAQSAIRFLRANAVAYGIDVTRIAIAGTSAGAITALNVGYGSAEDPSAAVGGAVSLSGAHLLNVMGPGDAPSLLFHGTVDNLVPYQWAVDTVDDATAAGLDAYLTTWVGAGHVPYTQHRTEILDQTTNFLYWEMDLATAAQ